MMFIWQNSLDLVVACGHIVFAYMTSAWPASNSSSCIEDQSAHAQKQCLDLVGNALA
jgi:hypothetical protein